MVLNSARTPFRATHLALQAAPDLLVVRAVLLGAVAQQQQSLWPRQIHQLLLEVAGPANGGVQFSAGREGALVSRRSD